MPNYLVHVPYHYTPYLDLCSLHSMHFVKFCEGQGLLCSVVGLLIHDTELPQNSTRFHLSPNFRVQDVRRVHEG